MSAAGFSSPPVNVGSGACSSAPTLSVVSDPVATSCSMFPFQDAGKSDAIELSTSTGIGGASP